MPAQTKSSPRSEPSPPAAPCSAPRLRRASSPNSLPGTAIHETVTTAEPLTAREQDVLALLADGATNHQIAGTLGLSIKTVQNHISRILDKPQAADRTQAVLRARGITV
jgi:DNA-binding NarL/FixJ family response regulator